MRDQVLSDKQAFMFKFLSFFYLPLLATWMAHCVKRTFLVGLNPNPKFFFWPPLFSSIREGIKSKQQEEGKGNNNQSHISG
jgi:hypothetical protein